MRKLLLLCLLAISGTLALKAQMADSTAFKEYTGKYVFPEGSQVAEMKVVLENGILFAYSDQGNSELKRIEKDIFEIVVYTGTATFKRDDKGKINGVHIEVGELILDGRKSEDSLSVATSVR